MDRLRIFFNNLNNELFHETSGERPKIKRFYGHPLIDWDALQQSIFTSTELKRLHRRLGHPRAEKLYNVLKCAEVDNVDGKTRSILEDLSWKCKPSQTYAQAPRRFKFVICEDKDFNNTVFVDIFYIDSKPILYVVDEATRYQALRWLPNVTAYTVWQAMRLCWIDVYIGPPDIVANDAGKQFVAKVFQTNTELLHIDTKCVPIESPNSMSFVKRYHAPIRHAYRIVKTDAPELDPESALQMAVNSGNDSSGTDSLVTTLLVFGAMPRLGLPNDEPTTSTFQRAVALRKETEAMSKNVAKTQVSSAIWTRNGPDITDIHSAPLDSHVLVYRPELDRWQSPFALLGIKGETCTVLLPPPSGPKEFRTTAPKRSIPDDTTVTNNEDNTTAMPEALNFTLHNDRNNINGKNITDDQEKSNIYATKVIPQSKDHVKYAASRKKEIDGLIDRGLFKPATLDDGRDHRIYGSRFVDYVKHEGTPEAYEKSRFVIQGFGDEQNLLTHAPTVMRASQGFLLLVAPSDKELENKSRDVNQAFSQEKSKLRRKIFVRPNPVLGYRPDFLFEVIYPINGLPESPIHWFSTYSSHLKDKLAMVPSIYDFCFMYTDKCLARSSQDLDTPRGMVCLETDDTSYTCNDSFSKLEERMSKAFDTKPAKFVNDGHHLKFNCAIISRRAHTFTLTQADHINRLKELDVNNIASDAFFAERARGAYIASIRHPDATYAFTRASQFTKPEKRDFKNFNKIIKALLDTATNGVRFVPLDLDSVFKAVFVDAGFASNPDCLSQIGFIITLMYKHGHANIVHNGSMKSKRVTRSVLPSELFALVHGFDIASTIRLTLNAMLDRGIHLHVYTNSRSLYDCLVRINKTMEKRLLIDLRMLPQVYKRREITGGFWIPTAQNPADAFTKATPTPALQLLMTQNRLHLTLNDWVERGIPTWGHSDNVTATVCRIF